MSKVWGLIRQICCIRDGKKNTYKWRRKIF